jgi:hypothetical protein
MSDGAISGGFTPLKRKEKAMNRLVNLLLLLVFGMFAVSPATALAQEEVKSKSQVVMKSGDTVNLFYSGTQEVRKEICLNDVIPVYRETTTGYQPTKEWEQVKSLKEVGKVKVLSYIGDHYFQAKVVEGTVSVGDIATKKGTYCMIQPAK